MYVHRFFRKPALSKSNIDVLRKKLFKLVTDDSFKLNLDGTEICLYIESSNAELSAKDVKLILWVLSIPFQKENVSRYSSFPECHSNGFVIEIGPRLNFSTPFSTNAVSIFKSIHLEHISRVEYSIRYNLSCTSILSQNGDSHKVSSSLESRVAALLHDRMTQCQYKEPIKSFKLALKSDDVFEVDIMNEGRVALETVNSDMGLAFDEWDLDFYYEMFTEKIKRNPTNVECFDLAQSNSEHSRHWFFKGRMVVDGAEDKNSLFQMVTDTQQYSNNNNLLKFCDNSSCIEGHSVKLLYPENSSKSSLFRNVELKRNIILTAETHNFPTGVAPFQGATTGTGGRIRDVQATGTGAHVVAGTAGYSFGNILVPGYDLPWEDKTLPYPRNFARPLDIAIEASNGASDYGNKFGEPVLTGFSRSFGGIMPDGSRREWIKPIMFSGGLGSMDDKHTKKDLPEVGMEVVKIGGPVYCIGVGGGAASSVEVQGDNKSELDYGAVQRGDAEMEQKLNRVIRACIEMGDKNPIRSIHDQGAGGNGNVLKEICEPAGANIRVESFELADPSISTLALWGAEYQESNAILVKPSDCEVLKKICLREKCPVSFVGTVTGDGKIRLEHGAFENSSDNDLDQSPIKKKPKSCIRYPVDLELDIVLGKMPRKVFNLDHVVEKRAPLELPCKLSVMDSLNRVLRLPSVASKRYLTNKVDRSVTGLVAQQQCVGLLHTPLADVAVTALSHFDTVGAATAIGEQPIKGLVDAACGARMSVGEALTNMVFAYISDLKDVKCSANWMWAAKLAGEGALLYDACRAMCDVMKYLGVAVDGGKDSLSMAARVDNETVKAPGTLVVSTYAVCPDIRLTVTPDATAPNDKGILLHIDLSEGRKRLGGSALAQCFSQVGDVCPDLDNPNMFVKAFHAVQSIVKDSLLSAGHDISDGGLITCALEMAFAGNTGLTLDLNKTNSEVSLMECLFAEELGWILEVRETDTDAVCNRFKSAGVPCHIIGHTSSFQLSSTVKVLVNDEEVLNQSMLVLRDMWEETSFQLERLQTNPSCVQEEQSVLKERKTPAFHLSSDMNLDEQRLTKAPEGSVKVAVIREEGSNGDREMVAALHIAGFQVWDVNMQDLCKGEVTLDQFRGVVFVGGFSYADVLGSAKGWAATLLFHPDVRHQFDKFREREDTFSLGVCNGCQLMALLGWVAPDDSVDDDKQGLLLDHNLSERFESRFVTIKIHRTPSIMLKTMENTVMGVWVAHGEGRMVFKNEETYTKLKDDRLVALSYVDDDGVPTKRYPFNPNGSNDGLAGLCSKDGRHLAMMPHPERSILPWQWPWMPTEWKSMMKTSTPWIKMFHNAYDWCTDNF